MLYLNNVLSCVGEGVCWGIKYNFKLNVCHQLVNYLDKVLYLIFLGSSSNLLNQRSNCFSTTVHYNLLLPFDGVCNFYHLTSLFLFILQQILYRTRNILCPKYQMNRALLMIINATNMMYTRCKTPSLKFNIYLHQIKTIKSLDSSYDLIFISIINFYLIDNVLYNMILYYNDIKIYIL